MPTSSRTSSVRPLPSSEGSQTLVEYLKIVEPPPLPGPKPVNILDVLTSVYGETADVEAIETVKPEMNVVVDGEKTDIDNSFVESLVSRTESGSFKLARFAVISAITGWLLMFVLFSSFGAFLFFCLEGLGLVLATASYSYPKDCPETRPMRIIAFALSVGWMPLIFLFLFGWPSVVLFILIAIVSVVTKKMTVSPNNEGSESIIDTDL